jgi:hypothetical protein
MSGEDRKPWDARLVEWMSRDSYRTDTRKSTAKGRAGLVAIWVLYATISATIRHASWLSYAYVVLVALIGTGWWPWGRKRPARTEHS